jgi:hypothetical protein
MKIKQWVFRLCIMGWMMGSVLPAFSVSAPPITVDFESGSLSPLIPLSSTEGRITVVGDSANVATELIGDQNNAAGGSGGNRMRGNYYQCDETVALYKQSMHLGRSQQTAVTFVVYESSTSGGTYSLIASNVVSASTGTNLVQSGEINALLRAGKYYMIGAAWDASSTYRYYGNPHPIATSFGHTLSGYGNNIHPAPQTTSGSTSTLLYPQQLIIADNLVARLDDWVGASLSSINSLNLVADLGGYSEVYLSFRYRDNGDEQDPEDGVFLSTDGGNNYFLIDNLSDSTLTWKTKVLDISAFAATQGLTLSSSSVIRFQQKDNWGWASGPDGREFDDIKLYSKPDLEAVSLESGGSTSISKLWKGFTVVKQIPLEFEVQSRGGNTILSAPSVRFGRYLYNSGGILQLNAYDTLPWSIGAMEIRTDTLTPVLTIPASTHLPDLNYTVRAFADAFGVITEEFENNNDDTISVTVNHYSGSLWFNNVETSITISGWGTRVANSPVEHWITGTGILDGQGFSFTNLKVDKNLTTLDYSLDSTETTIINVQSPDREQINGISFWRDGGIKLRRQGAYANIKVLLPAGLGISSTSTNVLDSTHTFTNRRLSPTLYPYTVATSSGPFFMAEESKPLVYVVTSMSWNPTAATFSFARDDVLFVRENEMAHLEAEAVHFTNSVLTEKKSNAAYYRGVSAIVTDPLVETGANGEALLSTELVIDQTAMTAHFPYGVEQAWNNGSTFIISQDLIDTIASQMNSPANIDMAYARDCNEALACAGSLGPINIPGLASGHTTASIDGGLRTQMIMPVFGTAKLQWGTRSNNSLIHSTDSFGAGSFYMPGHFIRGDLSSFETTDQRGPAEILLSGMAVNPAAAMERPGEANYADGLADYAGLNLRVGTDAALDGASVIGGIYPGDWPLTGRSKYYTRHSGVSGIHEAVYFPSPIFVYGYEFDVSNFGLSFLSGTPKDSRFNGSVDLPQPSNITMDFEELMLDCLGELEEAELANNDSKTLEYWDADIQPLTLFFASTANSSCGSADRKLCMGLTTQCANVDQTLSGVLAFLPSGELGAPADLIVGVTSRLAVPNQIELAGPGNETYYFNPVAMPYYNDYSLSGDGALDRGWINFAGNLDVAFFCDLQVHFHTSASTNSAIANIHMMGGWETNATQTFFNSDPDDFDTANAGFPNGAVSVYQDYRSPAGNTYRPRALRTWLGVVDFDYPLEWSFAAKSFKSPEPEYVDLMVMNVEHQTDYLSADNAEISFGVQYDGLPQVNLANMAFNAIDDATGMASAFGDAVGEALRDSIDSGVSAMDDTLADVPEMLFDPVFEQVLDPLIDDFYGDLSNAYAAAPNTDYYSTVVTQYILGVGAAQYQHVDHILKKLADGTGMATDLLEEIDGNLEQVEALLNAFIGTVSETNNISLPSPLPGLLDVNSGEYQTLTDLGTGLLSVLADTLYDSLSATIEEELNAILADAAPSLEAITDVMQDLLVIVGDARTSLETAGSMILELDAILDSPALNDPLADMSRKINQWFAALPSAGTAFDEYTADEIKQMLRQQITDAFYGSVPCADVQQVVRARLYEVDAAIQQTIDSAFQQLNKALRDLASEFLNGIDDSINAMLGDLSNIMGAGQIDGYAHIRHDSLAELRLDGKFQWEVPDEMEFNAYLIIKQLDSDNSGGCGVVGAVMPEVTLGTTGFGISWLDSDIKADIATKFTFKLDTNDDIELIGLGGSFEMVEGQIGFESFAIDEFYASVAFGALENYFSASLRCSFTSYEVEGGAFFGKACSLDPFSWDPDVQSILGDPPFTGVYVYGEGWMPIVDFGCLFRIKAGVGAGIFAFVDGPVGGKIFLGADGEALCVVGVSGDVTLVGLKDGDDMRMTGKGRVSGRVGSCPFCIKFGKTVTISYDNGSWDADY